MTIASFSARRAKLIAHMQTQGGGVAVIPTAHEVMRNRDADYPYRHDSYFYYLSGFTEPEALIVLIATPGQPGRSILFCRDKNPEREIWDGYRFGPDAARAHFGFDDAYAVDALGKEMPQLLADAPAVFYALGHDAKRDGQLQEWLQSVRALGRTGVSTPSAIVDVNVLLDEMRLFKDTEEIAVMKRAGIISAEAHCRAMRLSRPGLREYQLEAEILHEFRNNGSQYPAYGSIVATGANACVLHYRASDAELKDGDLVLIDAGCELDSYASDITRTFPANGKFSGPQKNCMKSYWPHKMPPSPRHVPASVSWMVTMPPCGCWRKACSTPACSTKTKLAHWTMSSAKATTASSTCTAPATGWAWMCTMSENTATRPTPAATSHGVRCSPAWCSRSSLASTSVRAQAYLSNTGTSVSASKTMPTSRPVVVKS